MSIMWVSEEQRADFFATRKTLPYLGGECRQPIIDFKSMSCDFGPDDTCACVEYERRAREEYGAKDLGHQIRYNRTATWSDIMKLPDDQLMSDEEMELYI